MFRRISHVPTHLSFIPSQLSFCAEQLANFERVHLLCRSVFLLSYPLYPALSLSLLPFPALSLFFPTSAVYKGSMRPRAEHWHAWKHDK